MRAGLTRSMDQSSLQEAHFRPLHTESHWVRPTLCSGNTLAADTPAAYFVVLSASACCHRAAVGALE